MPTCVLGSAGLGAAIVAYPQVIPVVLLCVLGLLAALTVNRFLAPSPLSPVWVTAAVYAGVALFGLVYWDPIPVLNYGTRTLPLELVGRTSVLFLSAAVFVLLGASCYLAITGATRTRFGQGFTTPSFTPGIASGTLLLLAAVIPTLLILVGASHGIQTLLHRPSYIEGRTDIAPVFALGQVLALAAVTISGYCWSDAKSWTARVASVGVVLLYAAIFFSLASRSLAVVPVAFAFGTYAAKPGSRASRLTIVASLCLSLTLLAIPLYLRNSSDHGLFPYLQTLAGNDTNANPVRWDTLPLNVLSTFGLSGDVAFLEPSIPLKDLWPSVNPLPGSVAGWYAIQPSHRVDVFSPYSTIGELGNYGLPILAGYYLLAGALLALFDVRGRALIARGQQFQGLGLIALGLLFPILSLQYQLRADTRILYYSLVLVGISSLLSVMNSGGDRPSVPVAAPRLRPRQRRRSAPGSKSDHHSESSPSTKRISWT
jgi:hypothetical protein